MSNGVLVIGIGGPSGGDDAVGMRVVEALGQTAGVRTQTCSGDLADLVSTWSGEPAAIVVDAMYSGRTPGAVLVFEAHKAPLPQRAFAAPDSFGLAEAIELSRSLGTLPARLVVLAIESGRVGSDAPMSPTVEAAVEVACRRIRSLAKKLG